MTNEERILEAVEETWPDWITNSQLCSKTSIRPHTQVFQLTRKLMNSGQIRGVQRGKEWFFAATHKARRSIVGGIEPEKRSELIRPQPCSVFEATARAVLRGYFGTDLQAAQLRDVPKRFDLVSPDGSIVGDAKFFDMVRGEATPPAKFSIIAEHVGLLERSKARIKFLVFGNNRRVPETWLTKHGHLA